jgi:hypothetical protein
VVEQKNLHLATVIGINDTGAGIDEVLRGKARAGGNAAIYPQNKRISLDPESMPI